MTMNDSQRGKSGADGLEPGSSSPVAWRQPTPLFLPGEYHEQRNLAGYGPGGHKELDMTEWLTTATLMLLLGRSNHWPIGRRRK